VLDGIIAQFWSPADCQTELHRSPGEQPVREMHQVVLDGLPMCMRNTKACVLDEERKDAIKFW